MKTSGRLNWAPTRGIKINRVRLEHRLWVFSRISSSPDSITLEWGTGREPNGMRNGSEREPWG